MKKITSPKMLKLLRLLHLLAAQVWLGGAVCIGVYAYYCFSAGMMRDEFIGAAQMLALLSKIILLPCGLTIILGGLIYGAFTKWRFFKHGWLTAKWLLTLAAGMCIGLGALNRIFAFCDKLRALPADAVVGAGAGVPFFIFWGLQIVILLVISILSVYKPHKKAA